MRIFSCFPFLPSQPLSASLSVFLRPVNSIPRRSLQLSPVPFQFQSQFNPRMPIAYSRLALILFWWYRSEPRGWRNLLKPVANQTVRTSGKKESPAQPGQILLRCARCNVYVVRGSPEQITSELKRRAQKKEKREGEKKREKKSCRSHPAAPSGKVYEVRLFRINQSTHQPNPSIRPVFPRGCETSPLRPRRASPARIALADALFHRYVSDTVMEKKRAKKSFLGRHGRV